MHGSNNGSFTSDSVQCVSPGGEFEATTVRECNSTEGGGMKSIGIVFLGLLSLFGCTAKVRPSEHFPTIPPIAVPQARTSSSGAVTTDAQGNTLPVVAAEIDPDCPYLTVEVLTPKSGGDADERRVLYEIQRPYIDKFSAQLERAGFKA